MHSMDATGRKCYVLLCYEKSWDTGEKNFSQYLQLFHNIRTTYVLWPLALLKVTFQQPFFNKGYSLLGKDTAWLKY